MNNQYFISNRYGQIERIVFESFVDGEWQLRRWFRQHGYEVADVSEEPRFQKLDIDMFVKQQDVFEEPVAIEVKWDDKISYTGNLFIEYHTEKLNPEGEVIYKDNGWFNSCKADLLYYGDSRNSKYYVFKFHELKQYIDQNNWRYEKRYASDYGDDVYKTEGNIHYCKRYKRRISHGWLVPLQELIENVGCQIQELN